jgi:hypothetical protein
METVTEPFPGVISAIKALPEILPLGSSNHKWTITLKESLIHLAERNAYKVCAAGLPNRCEREWLFDLVWYRKHPGGHLADLKLILECEWHRGTHKILYDFQKLLVGKVPIKVMVFQDYGDNLEEIFSLLMEAISAFSPEMPGERYILAGYRNGMNDFAIRTVDTNDPSCQRN